jgi:hypothetical protein
MATPLTITFPKSKPSPWLEAEIRDRVDRLSGICADILSCRVVVDIPHKHHQRGNRFCLRIEVSVPGEDLAITRDANLHAAVKDMDETQWAKRFDVEGTRRDIRIVVGDAFDAARRRLRDYVQLRRGDVKRHAAPPRGFAPRAGASRRAAAARVAASAEQ